nr:transglutaminase family protein [uncultured Draconibacterium sp.]
MKANNLFIALFGIILTANNLFSQQENNLSVFLKPTKYINSDNQDIISKATELTSNCDTDVDKVRVLFEFVRDSYNADHVDSFVASEILKNGGNFCYQRSILLAALCRAIKVPSRLQYQSMILKDFFFDGKKKIICSHTHSQEYTYTENGIYMNLSEIMQNGKNGQKRKS